MPAKSIKQQQYFGMVKAGKIKKPKGMKMKDVDKFARTKHKGLPRQVKEHSIKELIGGMTFSQFLMVEAAPGMDQATVHGFARSLPQYQDLIRGQETRKPALALLKQLKNDLGDGPIDQQAMGYIEDQFDQLDSEIHGTMGANIGDWRGEAEAEKRREREEREAQEADEAEAAARTEYQGRRKRSARTGMDYRPDVKQRQAAADFASFGDAGPDEQADRLAGAKAQVGVPTARPGSKSTAMKAIFDEEFGTSKPSAIIRRMMDEVGVSKPHATTYYYKFKKRAAQAETEGM